MQGRVVFEALAKRLNQTETEAIQTFLKCLLLKSTSKPIVDSTNYGTMFFLVNRVAISLANLTYNQVSEVRAWLNFMCNNNIEEDNIATAAIVQNCDSDPIYAFRCSIPAEIVMNKLVNVFFPLSEYQVANPLRLYTPVRTDELPSEFTTSIRDFTLRCVVV